MRSIAVVVALLAALFALLATACSDDDNGGNGQGGADSDDSRLELTARGSIFTSQLLPGGPDREVTLVFRNEDEGLVHNVAFYRTEAGGEPFFRLEPVTGRATKEVEMQTPAVGTYFYRCEFHPQAMRGELVIFATGN